MDDLVHGERPPAPWSTRAAAWLVDVLLVGVVVSVLGDLLGLGPGLASIGSLFDVGRSSVLLFAYWTLFEAIEGQSAGKLALDLQVVGDDGGAPSFPAAAVVQSFGKASLLPLDVVIGVLAMRGQRRRLFNRLSGTWVVSVAGPRQRNRGPAPVDA